MHLLPILALTQNPGGSAFDEMLRLFGIAAIVFAFFKGIKLLLTKPPAPLPPVAAPAAAWPPDPAPVASSTGIAPEMLAVIAAAVAAVTGSHRRIVSIRSASSLWEKAGRQSVLTSHRIR